MKQITISEFFGEYYKQQAQNDNFSRLGNIFGFKPTANKVLNTMLSRNINTWEKVEVVSNLTALDTLYMGGSKNIDDVTVNICTSYVGASNLPLLATKGDFGARLDKSASASRYIFTRLHPNINMVFNKVDLNVLPRYNFENTDIEYQFLTFNVPMLLLNGSKGTGTGHAQKIYPRKLEDLKKYITTKLKKQKKNVTIPVHYNNYKGTVVPTGLPNQWRIRGCFERKGAFGLVITEVPVEESYLSYIKKLDSLVDKGVIKSYKDLCNPKTDEFLFELRNSIDFNKQSDDEIYKALKLETTITENFTVVDENNSVVPYTSPEEVIDHYMRVRLKYLGKRKDYLINNTLKKIEIDESKYEFIRRIQEDELIISKRSKRDIVKDLDSIDEIKKVDGKYDYLLGMSIQTLTTERMQELSKAIQSSKDELKKIQEQTLENMWLEDLKKIKG